MKGSRVQISDSALKIKRLHFDATSFFLPDSFDESEKAETSAVVPFRQTDRHNTAIRKTRHSATARDNYGQSPGIPQQSGKCLTRGSHAALPCRRGIKRPRMQKVPTPRNPPPHFPHKSPLRSASTGAREHRARNPHPEDQPRRYRDSAPTRRNGRRPALVSHNLPNHQKKIRNANRQPEKDTKQQDPNEM